MVDTEEQPDVVTEAELLEDTEELSETLCVPLAHPENVYNGEFEAEADDDPLKEALNDGVRDGDDEAEPEKDARNVGVAVKQAEEDTEAEIDVDGVNDVVGEPLRLAQLLLVWEGQPDDVTDREVVTEGEEVTDKEPLPLIETLPLLLDQIVGDVDTDVEDDTEGVKDPLMVTDTLGEDDTVKDPLEV